MTVYQNRYSVLFAGIAGQMFGAGWEQQGSGGDLGGIDGAWGGLVCAERAGASQQGNRGFKFLQLGLHLEQNSCLPLFKNSFIIAGLARG